MKVIGRLGTYYDEENPVTRGGNCDEDNPIIKETS